MPTNRCPICKKEALPVEENEASPFCSARCRLLDLGNWLDDRYKIPGQPSDDKVDVPTAGDRDDE